MCKHNWQATKVWRDSELDIKNDAIIYKGLKCTFVCHKCKKVKTEDVEYES